MGILTASPPVSLSPDEIARIKKHATHKGVALDITLSRGTHQSHASVSLQPFGLGAFDATSEAAFRLALCDRLDTLISQVTEIQAAIRSGR